jgi:hypothetical protein
VVLAVALTDAERAARIAATIADEFLRALVMAVQVVRADPGNAEPLLREAEKAAGGAPAQIIEAAMVTARIAPRAPNSSQAPSRVGPMPTTGRPNTGEHERWQTSRPCS